MWSEAGLANLRAMNDATLDTDLVLRRANADLDPQRVALRRVSQQAVNEDEPISIGGAVLEIRGTFDLDAQQDDTFTWEGKSWRVTQPAIATKTNTSVARRMTAVLVV